MVEIAKKKPNPTAKKSVRTTVSVPVDDYAELERIASQKKVSVAWVVRDAVQEYLASRSPLFRRKVPQ